MAGLSRWEFAGAAVHGGSSFGGDRVGIARSFTAFLREKGGKLAIRLVDGRRSRLGHRRRSNVKFGRTHRLRQPAGIFE